MKLSVIIIFCDKDFIYLDSMIDMVEKFVKVEHEIILVDNRNNQTPFETKHKVVSKGENCYILEGRRLGLDEAKGEYIWFVDVDDEIIDYLTEEDLKDRTEKIIQLHYKVENKERLRLNRTRSIVCFGSCIWSRLYKTETLKEKLEPIKRNIKLVNGEDRFILDLMLSSCKGPEETFVLQKYLYNYKSSRAAVTEITKEKAERSLMGSENLDYLYSFLPQTAFYKNERETIEEFNNTFRKFLKENK